jgi:hypothetical protein
MRKDMIIDNDIYMIYDTIKKENFYIKTLYWEILQYKYILFYNIHMLRYVTATIMQLSRCYIHILAYKIMSTRN